MSPDQLQQALSGDQVQQVAAKSGLDVGQLLPIVAAALPVLIDTTRPKGELPRGDATQGVDIGGVLEGMSSAAQAGPDSPLAGLGALLGGSKG